LARVTFCTSFASFYATRIRFPTDTQLTLNCSFPTSNYCPSLQWRCAPFKPSGSTFNIIRWHVLLKKVVSWLERGQKAPFLREICPLKKTTPKYNAASGIIAGELLKVLPDALYGPHLHCRSHGPTSVLPFSVEFQLGIDSGSRKS
jgi:hypothetical protein